MPNGNLRHQTRKTLSVTVRVGWRDEYGREKSALTKSFDISASGMRFELFEQLRPRADVTLRSDKIGLQARGVVRSCTRKGTKFAVGVEFGGGYRWSPPSEEIRRALEEEEMLVSSER